MPSAPIEQVEEQLARLHAHYTTRMNAAVAAGRMDLVEDLASACHEEALEMMLDLDDAAGLGTKNEVEILELGAEWPWQAGLRSHPWKFRFWRRRG